MSSKGGGIAFYKQTLIENYESLFSISGNEKLDDRGSITERMRLLYTILMDEQQLNILLGYDTNSSLYYLLDERKIDEILSKAKENTDKIKLLEGIVSKANGLISSIRKEERIKDSHKELIKKQKDIEDKKLKILKYINDNNNYKGEGVIVLKGNEYIILASKESIEYPQGRGGYSKTISYILYKPDKLYTATTEEVNNNKVEKISLLESSNLSYKFSGIYDNLYDKLEGLSLSSGGNKASTAYKSTGDKVRLFIDNKKLHRSIYVKGNGKAKYCKINNEFVLLSKLKNKVIE